MILLKGNVFMEHLVAPDHLVVGLCPEFCIVYHQRLCSRVTRP